MTDSLKDPSTGFTVRPRLAALVLLGAFAWPQLALPQEAQRGLFGVSAELGNSMTLLADYRVKPLLQLRGLLSFTSLNPSHQGRSSFVSGLQARLYRNSDTAVRSFWGGGVRFGVESGGSLAENDRLAALDLFVGADADVINRLSLYTSLGLAFEDRTFPARTSLSTRVSFGLTWWIS